MALTKDLPPVIRRKKLDCSSRKMINQGRLEGSKVKNTNGQLQGRRGVNFLSLRAKEESKKERRGPKTLVFT